VHYIDDEFFKLLEAQTNASHAIDTHTWIPHPQKSATFKCTKCGISGGINPRANYKKVTRPTYLLPILSLLTCDEKIMKDVIE